MARLLGRWLTGGCHCRPRDNRSWGPDCAGHVSDPRQFKRIEARELDREIAEAQGRGERRGIMTGQPEYVSVNREALDALIEYADHQRSTADSQFCVSLAEYEASQREFDELVAALRLPADS